MSKLLLPTLALLLLAARPRGIHAFSSTALGSGRRTALRAPRPASSAAPLPLPRRSCAAGTPPPRHADGRGGAVVLSASADADGAALPALFAAHGTDGLMTEEELRDVSEIKDMLEQGDLLASELAALWKATPKILPAAAPSAAATASVERIDVAGFIRVYREIEALFEEEEDEAGADAVAGTEDAAEGGTKEAAAAVAASGEAEAVTGEAELREIFAALGGKGDQPSISLSQLRQWDEVAATLDDGTLGEDELASFWETYAGGDRMDFAGFVKFNDDVFEIAEGDDEEAAAAGTGAEEVPAPPAPRPTITEPDLPPGVLFSQLADENYRVAKDDLLRWGELKDMLDEGEVTFEELNALFDKEATGSNDVLDEEGFCRFHEAIDQLFEDDDDDAGEGAPPPSDNRDLKEELLEYLEDIAQLSEEEGQQMCGLDCSEMEQTRVLEVVRDLEKEPYNRVVELSRSGGGAVQKEELVGTWELVYSSSSTMKYNNGLSALAGGLTRFGGLQQKLSATKYLSDVEYTEQAIGKFGGQEAEFKIVGDWDLRTEVSLFTGKPSNVLSVVPDKVIYGPRSDKADHWKSLGPMNLLVLSYLDSDLRIMRGNTSVDTLFILRRISK